ncbi:hypothetical protein O3M35_013247 [Rhynocoris fuscipes]|uniref:Uncharacterized protein n=1 Tax=Rhynocoris fuscipes TaxID=488301 RepID=A0AAW1CEQ1_9HEMI
MKCSISLSSAKIVDKFLINSELLVSLFPAYYNSAAGNQGKRDAYSGLETGDYHQNSVQNNNNNHIDFNELTNANLVQHVSQMINDIYKNPNIVKDLQKEFEYSQQQYESSTNALYNPSTSYTKQVSYPQFVTPVYAEKPVEQSYYIPQHGSYESGQDYSGEKSHELTYTAPIQVEKPVPYPVPVKAPYPVSVPQPYPVPIEKPIPYPVVKPIPYPVHYPVPIEHYNTEDAFKKNQETFGFANYHGLQNYQYQLQPIYQKIEPQIPNSYLGIPNFSQFPVQLENYGNFNLTAANCNCTFGTAMKQNQTTTTMRPSTTTSRPSNPKASLISFLLRNLSSS